MSNYNNGFQNSIFELELDGSGGIKYKIRARWKLHLYISQLPCGDASLSLVPSFIGDCSELIGLVQKKPGRGDTTLSVSCSDKIACWNVVGVQGSRCLLGETIEKILVRAGYTLSNELIKPFEVNKPVFCAAPVPPKEFQHSETAQATLTCGLMFSHLVLRYGKS